MSDAELKVPIRLAQAGADPERAAWLTRLPGVVAQMTELWSLRDVGAPFEPGGVNAWVAPARDAHGTEVALKLAIRHDEALDEAAGLTAWAGAGAVRLLDATTPAPDTSALLLERCRPGASLAQQAPAEQDRVLAALLPRLWSPAGDTSGLRPLWAMCDRWVAGFRRRNQVASGDLDRVGSGSLDRGLVRAGLELFGELPRTAPSRVVLATDLHAENVLSAEREPWLMIDPKPYVGDPTYDVLQHMLNSESRLLADPHKLVDVTGHALDLDIERLTLWLFARCVVGSDAWPALADVAVALAPR